MWRTGAVLMVVGATGLAFVSCHNREPPPPDHEETVASHEEPLSGQGMETARHLAST